MAFDAYRTQDKAKPKRRRRVTYTVSVLFHGVLIAIGVAYSFWHVEELSPPTLRVTFMAGAPPPPPPPPPPPAGGGGQKKKITVKPKPTIVPTVKAPDIVQPRETPPPVKKPDPRKHDDDDDDDEPAGVKGGVKGGVAGGTVGGTIGGTVGGTTGGTIGGTGAALGAPKFLPPNMGALQKVSGSDPPFPAALRKAGAMYVVLAKICVSRAGTVESVTLMKRADPLLDDSVVNTVKGWHYRPLMANNTAIPFCYFGNFQFKSQ